MSEARKIFVGIPAYQGNVCVETMHALRLEEVIAGHLGIEIISYVVAAQSILHLGRNTICAEFLRGDCTDFVFIDADIGWQPGKLTELVVSKAAIAGGCYPRKYDELSFPVTYLPGNLQRDPETGLVEVEGLPGGFLHIKRHAFEEIIRQRPDLAYDDPYSQNREAHMFFEFTREGRQVFGEDTSFCRLARSCGFKIWLEPEISFDHVGRKAWRGNLGEFLLKSVPENERQPWNVSSR